jgi:hypothetical protein
LALVTVVFAVVVLPLVVTVVVAFSVGDLVVTVFVEGGAAFVAATAGVARIASAATELIKDFISSSSCRSDMRRPFAGYDRAHLTPVAERLNDVNWRANSGCVRALREVESQARDASPG